MAQGKDESPLLGRHGARDAFSLLPHPSLLPARKSRKRTSFMKRHSRSRSNRFIHKGRGNNRLGSGGDPVGTSCPGASWRDLWGLRHPIGDLLQNGCAEHSDVVASAKVIFLRQTAEELLLCSTNCLLDGNLKEGSDSLWRDPLFWPGMPVTQNPRHPSQEPK